MFKMRAEFLVDGLKTHKKKVESGGRILLGDNKDGRAVVLRPIRLQCVGILDLNWIPQGTNVYSTATRA